jgi:hypothetical protein
VQYAEAQQHRYGADVRHQQVQEAGAADRGPVMLRGDEKVRGEGHRLPGHHEQVRVVGEDDERHARQEHVVLQAHQAQPRPGLRTPVAHAVHRYARGHRAEHEQEEPGERVQAQVEWQVGKAERQHQAGGRLPGCLQADRGQREARHRARGEQHAQRETGPGGKQSRKADEDP